MYKKTVPGKSVDGPQANLPGERRDLVHAPPITPIPLADHVGGRRVVGVHVSFLEVLVALSAAQAVLVGVGAPGIRVVHLIGVTAATRHRIAVTSANRHLIGVNAETSHLTGVTVETHHLTGVIGKNSYNA